MHLRYQESDAKTSPDRPSAEIEVTPEMIEAGEAAWNLFSRGDPPEWVLPAIFRAMAAKSPAR